MVTYCVGTDIYTLLLKQSEKSKYKWWSNEEQGVSSYMMALRKRDGVGN